MRRSLPACAALLALSCAGAPPGPSGKVAARGLQLAPCDGACVGSREPAGSPAAVAPIPVGKDRQLAIIALRRAAVGLPGGALAALGPDYLRVEYSVGWGQIDDLELALDPEAPLAHVRAARRGPWPDGGANAARVEALRSALAEAGAAPAGPRRLPAAR